MLMVVGRMKGGLVSAKDNEMIEKMAGELADVIEEFMRAVDVETLRRVQENGEHRCLNLAITILNSFM